MDVCRNATKVKYSDIESIQSFELNKLK